MGAPNTSFSTLRCTLRCLVAVLFFASTAAHAELQKFVYAYDSSGVLLAPSNAAAQCPDPHTTTHARGLG